MNTFDQCRVITLDSYSPWSIDLPQVFTAGWNYDVYSSGRASRDGNRAVDALVARLRGYGEVLDVNLSTEGAVIQFKPIAGTTINLVKEQFAIEADRFIATGRSGMPNLGEKEMVDENGVRSFSLAYYDRFQRKNIELWKGDLEAYIEMNSQLAFLRGVPSIGFNSVSVNASVEEVNAAWDYCADHAKSFGTIPLFFSLQQDSKERNFDEIMSMLTPEMRVCLAHLIATKEHDEIALSARK